MSVNDEDDVDEFSAGSGAVPFRLIEGHHNANVPGQMTGKGLTAAYDDRPQRFNVGGLYDRVHALKDGQKARGISGRAGGERKQLMPYDTFDLNTSKNNGKHFNRKELTYKNAFMLSDHFFGDPHLTPKPGDSFDVSKAAYKAPWSSSSEDESDEEAEMHVALQRGNFY